MGDVVNLRMARKRRDRADRQRLAAENRARHGVGKAEESRARSDGENAGRHLDDHRLTDVPPEE